jgi:hypothetical protein
MPWITWYKCYLWWIAHNRLRTDRTEAQFWWKLQSCIITHATPHCTYFVEIHQCLMLD